MFTFAPYLAVRIANNTITGCATGMAIFGGTVGAVPALTHNTVDGTGIADAIGVFVSTTLFDWGSASVQASVLGNTITGNTVGVLVDEEPGYLSTLDLHGNSISGNEIGLETHASTAVAADYNWWGCRSYRSG